MPWNKLAQRASRASHDLVGWIFWDPQAINNYADLGVPDGAGYYVATRFGPLAAAGNEVVAATAYSINPVFLGMALDICRQHTDFSSATAARDAAVVPGLNRIDPAIAERLAPLAEPLWTVADQLHSGARALFAAHRAQPRPGDDQLALSAWLAVNCLREWRGDTHWALCAAADLDAAEVGLLNNAMVEGYDAEWIARSRGADDHAIDQGWRRLAAKGFAANRSLTDAGQRFRQELEDHTDQLCGQMWQLLSESLTVELCELAEPHHQAFLDRIDATAGPLWMPAARN
ncbi:MAG TPA: hypothetical protein EYG34_06880 [Acidimicrobiia bacterium]|jgi:hypothetical protein|nr:hypothetical protein [Acidimicrobiia bacterium]HIL46823.1 hypothetical protein [Acidimicrobiia bacterium]